MTPHPDARETAQNCYTMAYLVLPRYVYGQPDILRNTLTGSLGGGFYYVMACQMNGKEPDGAPWESRKANWAHLVVRSGRPTGCAIGEARKAPKPNERGYRLGNRDGGVGSSERSARGANGGRRLRPQASRRSLGPLHFGKAALPILRS